MLYDFCIILSPQYFSFRNIPVIVDLLHRPPCIGVYPSFSRTWHMVLNELPCRYSSKILRTMTAFFSFITNFPSTMSYPSIRASSTLPFANRFRAAHFWFWLIDSNSSSARLAITVRIKPHLGSRVCMFSDSNMISTPKSRNSLTTSISSTLFRANLETDFVYILSISPFLTF